MSHGCGCGPRTAAEIGSGSRQAAALEERDLWAPQLDTILNCRTLQSPLHAPCGLGGTQGAAEVRLLDAGASRNASTQNDLMRRLDWLVIAISAALVLGGVVWLNVTP